jgi:hypothetical protein
MITPRSNLIIRAAVLALALGATTAVSAQTPPQAVRPPKIETPGPTGTWLAVLAAIVLGGIAVGVAVMPSQRTHQD